MSETKWDEETLQQRDRCANCGMTYSEHGDGTDCLNNKGKWFPGRLAKAIHNSRTANEITDSSAAPVTARGVVLWCGGDPNDEFILKGVQGMLDRYRSSGTNYVADCSGIPRELRKEFEAGRPTREDRKRELVQIKGMQQTFWEPELEAEELVRCRVCRL